jgi:hypothetical protein
MVLLPLWGCEGKHKQVPLGGCPSYGVNEGTGVDGPSVSMETACANSMLRALCRKTTFQDLRGPQKYPCNSKTIVYNVKKLLNNGVDLILW